MAEEFSRWLHDPVTGKLLAAVFGYLLIGMVVFLLKASINSYVAEAYFRYKAKKIFVYVGYFVALVFTLLVFSEHLGNLTVVLGVAGAGIAFALQEVIISLAGWVAISFGNFYEPGDRVQLGGITGDVIDIGILRTTLMETGQWVEADLYNGRVVKIANSFVFKEPVFNYSGSFPFLWDEIKLPIKYGSDYRLARQMIQAVAQETTGEYTKEATQSWKEIARQYVIKEASLAPQVTLAANDNWVEFTLRYVVDYRYRRRTKDAMFTAILERIEQSGGQVAMASATLHIVETPVLKVRQVERG